MLARYIHTLSISDARELHKEKVQDLPEESAVRPFLLNKDGEERTRGAYHSLALLRYLTYTPRSGDQDGELSAAKLARIKLISDFYYSEKPHQKTVNVGDGEKEQLIRDLGQALKKIGADEEGGTFDESTIRSCDCDT